MGMTSAFRGFRRNGNYEDSSMIIIKHMETEDEIKGKAYVHWKAWKEAYTGLIDQNFLDARTLETAEQRALKAFRNGYKTLIAKDGNRVVGFADYGSYRGDDLTDAGEVYAIYILKEYYGKGIGYALMTGALEELKSNDQTAVWVLYNNERAIRFYKRCGFQFDGKKQDIILGKPVTEARMAKK